MWLCKAKMSSSGPISSNLSMARQQRSMARSVVPCFKPFGGLKRKTWQQRLVSHSVLETINRLEKLAELFRYATVTLCDYHGPVVYSFSSFSCGAKWIQSEDLKQPSREMIDGFFTEICRAVILRYMKWIKPRRRLPEAYWVHSLPCLVQSP